MESKNLTAVEWLVEQLKERGYAGEFPPHLLFEQAKQMEREQHGRTWDSAIQAHEDRGHVLSRSFTDFDEYQIK